MEIYRAAESNVAGTGCHFAEAEVDARAYTDNPGFGGGVVYRFQVELSDVLDLTGRDWAALRDALLEGNLTTDEDGETVLTEQAEEAIGDWAQASRALRWLTELRNGNYRECLYALTCDSGYIWDVWESNSWALALLTRSYTWLRYEDNFPEGCTTLRYLGGETFEGVEI